LVGADNGCQKPDADIAAIDLPSNYTADNYASDIV
jgi:hypothetical protein